MPVRMLTVFLTATVFTATCHAGPGVRSATNAFSDNPFVAVGVNPATRLVTGYYSAVLTAPGRTDTCKFVFRGSLQPDGSVRLSIKDAAGARQTVPLPSPSESALLTATDDTLHIALPKQLAPGDCDWVLESIGGSDVRTDARGFGLSIRTGSDADWIGVVAIRSKRAHFHDTPDAATVRKAFLVSGDVAYAMEEKPGWYRLKFTHGAKQTVGWIKASDTIQF